MEIKNNKGEVVDRVLSLTKEGEKVYDELGFGDLPLTSIETKSKG